MPGQPIGLFYRAGRRAHRTRREQRAPLGYATLDDYLWVAVAAWEAPRTLWIVPSSRSPRCRRP